ncbi:MAG: hypothetical protein MUF05_07380 [Candidatus Omnitrophica bacterium]|jgi:hypothetical protein|nr:hypothetical protein [Candidatus Omnitrophota bacterium]
MKAIKYKKKKFVAIGQFDRKNDVEALIVKAENHEIACHLAEIKNGWGTFMACDEGQAKKIAKDIHKSLKNW